LLVDEFEVPAERFMLIEVLESIEKSKFLVAFPEILDGGHFTICSPPPCQILGGVRPPSTPPPPPVDKPNQYGVIYISNFGKNLKDRFFDAIAYKVKIIIKLKLAIGPTFDIQL